MLIKPLPCYNKGDKNIILFLSLHWSQPPPTKKSVRHQCLSLVWRTTTYLFSRSFNMATAVTLISPFLSPTPPQSFDFLWSICLLKFLFKYSKKISLWHFLMTWSLFCRCFLCLGSEKCLKIISKSLINNFPWNLVLRATHMKLWCHKTEPSPTPRPMQLHRLPQWLALADCLQ